MGGDEMGEGHGEGWRLQGELRVHEGELAQK